MPRLLLPPHRLRALPALVVANIAVFVLWHLAWALGPAALEAVAPHLVVSAPGVLEQGMWWTLLTSAFSHNQFGHLFFNLFALWIFGQDVERLIGARGFLHLYLAGGIVASLGHVLYGLVAQSPVPALGASGAVMAIAVVAAFLFPGRLLLLFFVIPMPQFVAVGLFVLLDLVGLLAPGNDLVAHAAHLGGAAYGWLYWRSQVRPWLIEQIRLQERRRYEDVWNHPWR